MKIKSAAILPQSLLLLALFAFPCARLGAQTANAPARITQALSEKNLVVLEGNVHPLARAEFDQGAVSDGQPLQRMLLLLQRGPDQEAALQNLLDDQQNKSSANYHAWLTPSQFGQQFGPADADIQAVTIWLQSHGFQITNVTAGRTTIEFSGNAAQVRSAFHTEIHKYLVNGQAHVANASDPQIPAALAPVVAGPVSLNNFPRKSYARILGQFRRTIGKPGLEPLFTFPDPFTGANFYGLGPGDFATIYNSKPLIASGNDGTGQTIAIVGETNINVQDVQQFRQMFALPANFSSANIILNGEDPGITSKGEEGEADLDVEWSGATAPGATVKFVVSASTPASAGIDLSALYIVEHNLAGAMSESYGECEQQLGTAGNAFYNQLWEQAAAQGITVILSAGDGGSAGCDNFDTEQVATLGLAVSGLASTPFNVSVGGTDFDQVKNWASFWSATNDATGSSAISYIPEIPWNQNCAQISLTGCGPTAPQGSVNIVAGSGGPSAVYAKPKWQMGVAGMPNDNHRDQPDISLFASPGFTGTGYVYCQSDQTISQLPQCDLNATNGVLDFGIVGGTSASAPAFAGIMALVNQYEASHGGTNRQGNANYVLYALAKKTGASCTSAKIEATGCVFNDVAKGNSILPTGAAGVGTNSVPCQGGTTNCSSSAAGVNGVLVDPIHATTEAWTATAGYDMTTGLGTLNVSNLATSWANVSTIPTATTLTLSPTTGITHGTTESAAVGITVKPNTGTGVPAGDVSLTATFPSGMTQAFDHFTLANGIISGATTKSLPGGTYNVSAHYAGDGTNAPSDSPSVQVTVAPETSRSFIVIPTFDSGGNPLSGNASSLVEGTSYIIRMYVTDKNGVANSAGPPSPTCLTENLLTCPTGTVSLTANGSPVDGGSFLLNTEGYTRDLAPTLTGGTYTLTAQYSGDNSYSASSATASLTIEPDPISSFGLQVSPPTPVVGSPLQFGIIAYSRYPIVPAPGGTITIFDGTTQLGAPIPVSGPAGGYEPLFFSNGSETLTTAGPHTLSAQYSGDANYGTASASTTFNVLNAATASISFTPSTVNYGTPIAITAAIDTSVPASNAALKPTGTITLNGGYQGQISTGVTVNTVAGPAGNWEIQISALTTPTATETFIVTYSGDSNYESASAFSSLVTVIIPDFSLSIPNAPLVIPVGQPGSLQISVVPATNNSSPVLLGFNSNPPVGYALSFQPSTVNLAGGLTGTSMMTLTPAPSGQIIHANNMRQKRAGFVFPLTSGRPFLQAVTATGFLALLLCVWAARRKNLRLAFALGTICALSLAIGCGGGSSFSSGGGSGGGNPVPQATATTLSAGSATVAQNASLTLTATVTGTQSPTGMVEFQANQAQIAETNLVNGTATTTVTFSNPGLYTITAQYFGDQNNLGSSSTGVSEGVTGTIIIQVSGQTSTVYHTANVTVTLQ